MQEADAKTLQDEAGPIPEIKYECKSQDQNRFRFSD